METIDQEDTLTLQISKPEGQELTPIGEIKINILDLYTNKNKKYLIGDDVSIDLKIKYVHVDDSSESPSNLKLHNQPSNSSASSAEPTDNTDEQAARQPSPPAPSSAFRRESRSKSMIRVNEATLRMQALAL